MKKLESNAVSRIIAETRKSRILAESLRETAKRIQTALGVGQRSATGIAHNSVHQMFNFAERETYTQDDQIKELRFECELDRKTTETCISLDQKVFPKEKAPLPPLHWKCRSMTFPIFAGVELERQRIARKDTQARTVKHRDGTTSTKFEKRDVDFVPGKTTHSQWVQSMVNSKNPADVSFSREMLGPGRFNMVKAGKFKVENLYYHGKLRTIKELKSLYE